MFTLKNLNVIRVVESEVTKAKLITEGFIDITVKEVEVLEEVIVDTIEKEVEEVIIKKSKGKG